MPVSYFESRRLIIFNFQEKGKTLLSVIFQNLSERENFWQLKVNLKKYYLKCKNSTMKGTM